MPARVDLGAVAYNGYLYVMGGQSGASGGDCTASGSYCNGTFYAPINSNGTIGSWAATTTFGITMPARANFGAVTYNGYLYVTGGGNNSSSGADCATSTYDCNGTFYAPINSNGTIGSWAATTTWPASSPAMPARALFGAVAYNGYLYVMGGSADASSGDCTATGFRCNGVFLTGLQSTPRVGYYSDLINLASSSTNPSGDVNPIEIVLHGPHVGNPGIGGISGPGGIITNSAMADNTCTTFSTPNTVNTGNSNQTGNAFQLIMTTNGCSTATNLASYLWLRFTLDDSQTVSFPDVNGNQTEINDFTVYYQPNPTYRLRGGATFNNGSLNNLSTPP